jgi:processive 1,2-diacylglycerol beta-glucosyltransferase
MEKRKKTVAILTATQGHLSIAEAIRSQLEKEYEIKWFKEVDFLFNFYIPAYRFFPGATRLPWKIAEHDFAQKRFNHFFELKYSRQITEFIKEAAPDAIVNTYFMYSPVLEKISAELHIPFLNVLTDPRSLHPLVISENATYNLAYDAHTLDRCAKFYPDASYLTTGWFVRPEFTPIPKKDALRKKLGVSPDTLTFLLASGSEGSALAMKILPGLMAVNHPVQIFVACGSNTMLFKATQTFSNMLQKVSSQLQIIPLRFRKDIYRYMQASDLVIGKAGPNMLFESVATGNPFFALTHIAGQEDGNLDIITEDKLGFVEERPQQAAELLKELIVEPKKIAQLSESVLKAAKYNQQAGDILQKTLQTLLR